MLAYFDLTTLQEMQISMMNAIVALDHNDIPEAVGQISNAQNLLTTYRFDEEYQSRIQKQFERICELEDRLENNQKQKDLEWCESLPTLEESLNERNR